MKRIFLSGAILLCGVLISLTVDVVQAAAQGPAGAGAPAAAQGNLHSLNPIKWVKKDSGNSADTSGSRSDAEKKLTAVLQTEGILPANANVTDACLPFASLDGCLAVLHAGHNLGLDFNCLRAEVTGVHTNADISGCKIADGEKVQSLNKAIHQLKSDANAKQATKDAEQQAKDDLKRIAD
jgi:hypothetical protein